jgi:2-dehydropantoate 2-reductase
MNICILGSGVIGVIYAYVLQEAGHHVEHLVREHKREQAGREIKVSILDGRENPKGTQKTDSYQIKLAQPGAGYDLILLSLSKGKLEAAIQTLSENNTRGTILLFCGVWELGEGIDKIMGNYPYILGYPVAGGTINKEALDCVLFDHIMLESKKRSSLSDAEYSKLVHAFGKARIKIEAPHAMLEWIWIHMAINAAVITTAAKCVDSVDSPDDTAKASERLMGSAKILSEAVLSVRETMKIVEARGVELKKYRNEIMPFSIPSKIAGLVMRRMFATNELTRKIMLLHNNVDDLVYVCKSVYDCGRQLGVKTPVFSADCQSCFEKLGKGE